jgi:hypothetical protein
LEFDAIWKHEILPILQNNSVKYLKFYIKVVLLDHIHSLEELILRIKYLKIEQRSRIFRAADSEKFRLEMELHGSEKEMERIRKAVFELEEGDPGNV